VNRIKYLQKSFNKLDIDAFLITSETNIRYLTNFTGTSANLLITKDRSVFFNDFRYRELAKSQLDTNIEFLMWKAPIYDYLVDEIYNSGIKRLGFEASNLSYSLWETLKDKFKKIKLIPIDKKIEEMRCIKDDSELRCIKKAVKIAEKSLDKIIEIIKPGITGKEISIELEYQIKKNGADDISFKPIVVSGRRTSIPHADTSERKVQMNDFLTIDFGAKFEGYCSDMTRTIFIGSKNNNEIKKIFNVVKKAQEIAINSLAEGVKCSYIDKLARDYISECGYGENFGHGLGHGIGLEVHEIPKLSSISRDVLKKGMIFTVEPGIYVEGIGGVRIEDMVYIGESKVEILTSA